MSHRKIISNTGWTLCAVLLSIITQGCFIKDEQETGEIWMQTYFLVYLAPNLESGVCPAKESVPEIQPGGHLQSISVGQTYYFTFPIINRDNRNDPSKKYQIDFTENPSQDVRMFTVDCLKPATSAFYALDGDSGFSGQSESVTSTIFNYVPASSGFGRTIILIRGYSGSGNVNISVPASAL